MCDCKLIDLTPLDPVLDAAQNGSSNLIAILQKTQELYGYLPMDAIYYIAQKTGCSPAKVLGVATFYAQFRLQPVGKHLIMLCKGTACHVNGADRMEKAISEYLGIHDGETTPDGLFTLKQVACLGCCSLSPVMMIGDEAYGSLTPEKAISILKDYQRKEGLAV
ncbi:MAG: NADH-quinone oxidoreductase subunit NuoE [Clostridiales bacterium]|nr:NADH-quinone oxidoreductase subunit NuoE [Clostridiales bacterium]